MNFDEFLTPSQVAQILNVSVKTVYRLVDDGLPSIRIGRLIRFTATDVHEYLRLGAVGDPHILKEESHG